MLLHIRQVRSRCDVDRTLDRLLLWRVALTWLVEGGLDQFLPVEVVYEMTWLLLRHEAAIHQLVVLLVLIQSRLVHGLRDVVKHRLLLELLDLALELGILLRLFCASVGPLLVMAHLVQYVHVDLLGPPMHLGARLHL